MTQRSESHQVVFWLLGALLVVLMGTITITHSMVMDRFDSLERRLERLESRNGKGAN